MKKTLSFQRLFLLLLAALVFCLAACKKEPDLPDDPHVPLVNPFVGVWSVGGSTEYWQFRPDGTGGRAAAQAGPFLNDFSFFIYAGQDVRSAPSEGSLIILDDNAVTRYEFSIADGHHRTATLTPGGGGGVSVTLDQISGDPQALGMTNPFIGEWSADWSLPGNEHDSQSTWSLKYRADGTVKVFHRGVDHQFENAYTVRGNTLVILGEMRFSLAPVVARIDQQENGRWQVTETQSNPPPAGWIYTKVAAAKWKE
jgi:hypothetical protein